MEYNDLNSYLGNLELQREETRTNRNLDNSEFSNYNQFSDLTINNKPKSRKQIENLSINRNMEISQLTREFNFESVNPQRIESLHTRNSSRDDLRNNFSTSNNDSKKQNTNNSFELDRNLQIHNSNRNNNIMLMDYSQFSENYKSYKNNDLTKDLDNRSLNEKLSSRENIPNISSVPSSLWKN